MSPKNPLTPSARPQVGQIMTQIGAGTVKVVSVGMKYASIVDADTLKNRRMIPFRGLAEIVSDAPVAPKRALTMSDLDREFMDFDGDSK